MNDETRVDDIYLRRALDAARASRAGGNHPFGACVVLNGSMLTEAGNNSVPGKGAATEHAELIAAREASRIWSAAELADATLYSSAEPCAMCAGAISHARLRRLYYGAADAKGGAVDHGPRFFSQPTCLHAPETYSGMAESEAAEMLKAFFKGLR